MTFFMTVGLNVMCAMREEENKSVALRPRKCFKKQLVISCAKRCCLANCVVLLNKDLNFVES